MSFLARVSYTANGSTDTFTFSFSYIVSSHIKVYVDGVEDTGITFPSASTVQLSSTPANGAVVLIQRETPDATRLVDFQDGSVLTSADLDQSADQNFYIAQETKDNVQSKLGLDSSDRYDAGNKRIINVANPVDNQDAVTKYYLENTWLSTSDKANLTTVAGISSAISSTASNTTNINLVAGQISPTNNISLVAGVQPQITSLGSITSEIATVANNETDIQALADLEDGTTATNAISNLGAVSTQIGNLATVTSEIANLSPVKADITTVAGQISPTNNISTLAGLNTEISALYNIRTDITAVANISTDIQDVQDKIAELQTVANDLNEVTSEIEVVANSIGNVDAVGADLQGSNNIGTVASNITDVNTFANRYRISATAPTTSLDIGDLYFDTATDTMKVYGSGGWQSAGSSVNGTASRYKFTATASQTTFTTADDSSSLAYDPTYLDVFLNGIKLVNGSDFTATTGNSIVLSSGANASDILEVIAYGTFALANFSITDANDVPTLGSAGQALVVNSGGTALEFANASSAEVYGFHKDSNGDLIVTTTNQGVDSISQSEYANFEEVLFSASGFSFSISNGELIATI